MAGMPKQVVQRSKVIMKRLEQAHSSETKHSIESIIPRQDEMQLSFFQLDDPTLLKIRDVIKDIDINSLTPVEALMKLNEIKKILDNKKTKSYLFNFKNILNLTPQIASVAQG